ncbi:MAG: hypothetical protein WBD47_05265 [Phormidesmis sp.]
MKLRQYSDQLLGQLPGPLLGLTVAVILSVGFALSCSPLGNTISSSLRAQAIAPENSVLIAYSVDYEMDKARVEKTVEHYGESVQPMVEQAIKNNEDNPSSKDTAENSYKRESPLNDLLPESWGQSFDQADLSDMRSTDNPRE